MLRIFLVSLLIVAWSLPAVAPAQAKSPVQIDIPAGSLSRALDALSRQTGMQFVYNADQLAGAKTRGVHGKFDTLAALKRLLSGSGFTSRRDAASGAIVIMSKASSDPVPLDSVVPAPSSSSDHVQATKMQGVVVTGSLIPRSGTAGPSPVLTITSEDIKQEGFANVPDLLQSLTQSLGALTNDQYANSFTPAARAVDLRGLGPNHTLVLVDGKRIADYPQAYGGSSNFTDISDIPLALIDRVEILTGSASAIYGADAMSGVVNFILKKHLKGVHIWYREGATQHGGYGSHLLDIATGFTRGKFDVLLGLDLYKKDALWAYQRDFTDSRLDAPLDPGDVLASRNFYRADYNVDYIDPGRKTCETLSHLDRGTMQYAYRPRYGYYCGTYADVGYGTLKNSRKWAKLFAKLTYHLSDQTELYLNVLGGTSHVDGYNAPLSWYSCEPDSTIGECADTDFYNKASGQYEQWGRTFTLEEAGGFGPGKIRNIGNAWSFNGGVRGIIGSSDWHYDAYFNHSQNKVSEKWPAVIAAKANRLYLGPRLGRDPSSGLPIYDADPARLYTPLTVDEFRSITKDSVDHDQSRAETYSLQITNTNLFDLPAGPVGMAAVLEYGNEYFAQLADSDSLDGTLYGLHNTTAQGSRNHAAFGSEFIVPVFDTLMATAAGRYDRYEYGDHQSGKFTYSLGLEYRPISSLLLRASYSTGFRAPDLNYLFEGLSGSSSSGTDYYRCRRDQPETRPDDFYYCDFYGRYNGRSHGDTDLNDETSKSWTYGFVYASSRNFNISADYYHIAINDEVQFQSSRDVLRREADCRLGKTLDGDPVDADSAFCRKIISQVVRNPASGPDPERVTAVTVLPINAASDWTSGIDLEVFYRLTTKRVGTFHFRLGATHVLEHKIQLGKGQPVENELTDLYYYLIPRTRANASVSWYFDDFYTTLHGSRLSGIPNYQGTKRMPPTYRANLTVGYKFSDHLDAWLSVDNLFDSKPQRPPDWTSYPYYYRSWFSPVRRAYYLYFKVNIGADEG